MDTATRRRAPLCALEARLREDLCEVAERLAPVAFPCLVFAADFFAADFRAAGRFAADSDLRCVFLRAAAALPGSVAQTKQNARIVMSTALATLP
ncbi:MAG: hypothetical protein IT160_10525 [Bryobacterales bacterium]|nr:hypothetical protein [Bryobacterales bacterium]